MLKIRRSRDRLIFNMGIPLLVRRHILLRRPPASGTILLNSIRRNYITIRIPCVIYHMRYCILALLSGIIITAFACLTYVLGESIFRLNSLLNGAFFGPLAGIMFIALMFPRVKSLVSATVNMFKVKNTLTTYKSTLYHLVHGPHMMVFQSIYCHRLIS